MAILHPSLVGMAAELVVVKLGVTVVVEVSVWRGADVVIGSGSWDVCLRIN
jgi:hypothetical protein